MKIRITLKDPDGVYDSIKEATSESLLENKFIDEKEREAAYDLRKDRLDNMCSKFIEYGEYVTIEIDTDDGTAIVIPVKE